jgi:hypothetical protein
MTKYNKFSECYNGQLDLFEHERDEPPTLRAVHKLAERAGISESHARAALVANGPRHD